MFTKVSNNKNNPDEALLDESQLFCGKTVFPSLLLKFRLSVFLKCFLILLDLSLMFLYTCLLLKNVYLKSVSSVMKYQKLFD